MTLAPVSSIISPSQQSTVLGDSTNTNLPVLGVASSITQKASSPSNRPQSPDSFQYLTPSLSEIPLFSSVQSPSWQLWLKAHKQQLKQGAALLAGIGIAGLTAVAGHQAFKAFRTLPAETSHVTESFVEAPAMSYVPPLESIEDFVPPEWLGDYRQRWAKGHAFVEHVFEDFWEHRHTVNPDPFNDVLGNILSKGLAHIGLPQCRVNYHRPYSRGSFVPIFELREGQFHLGSIGFINPKGLPESLIKESCKETLMHEVSHMLSSLAISSRRDYSVRALDSWPDFIPRPVSTRTGRLFGSYLLQQPSFAQSLKALYPPLGEEMFDLEKLLYHYPETNPLLEDFIRKTYTDCDHSPPTLEKYSKQNQPLTEQQKKLLLMELDHFELDELEACLSSLMAKTDPKESPLSPHDLFTAIVAWEHREVARLIARTLKLNEANYPILQENPFA